MKDSIRLRLLGVGIAVAGLVVGTGLGAIAGSALSPEPETAAPSTSTTSTTTTLPAPVALDQGRPLDDAPLFVSVGLEPGALVSIVSDQDGSVELYRLGEQGTATRIDLGYEGRLQGFGRATAVVTTASGSLLVPIDGGNATSVTTAPVTVVDAGAAWVEENPGGSWTLRLFDLDDPAAVIEARATFTLPRSAGSIPLQPLHVDDRGAVLVGESIWVVPTDAPAWSLDGPWPQAVLPDTIVTATPPEDENDAGEWPLALLDRRTGERVGGPLPSPVDTACAPLDAAGGAIAWACEDGRPVVSMADGTVHRLAADWVTLADAGRVAVWYSESGAGDSSAVRVTDLSTGETASVRSDHVMVEVLP
jgi:hypothetical protein